MIYTLTKEQEAALPFYRDTWLVQGLQTRTDRAAAEAAIDRLYIAAGKAAPPLKIWCESPMACALAVAILGRLPELAGRVIGENAKPAVRNAVRNAVDNAVGNAVGNAVDNAVGNAVDNAVRNAVHNAVDNAVRNAVDNAVGNAVGNAVRNAVDNAVRNAVHNAVDNAVRNAVHNAVDNAVDNAVGNAVRNAVHNAVDNAVDNAVGVRPGDWWDALWGYYWWKEGWGGYVAYMRDVLGAQTGAAGDAIIDVGRDCGWTWLFERAVFFSDRPVEIHTNAQGRSHKDGGMAVKYGDGWGVYCLNGVSVTHEIAETPGKELPATLVTQTPNAEIRRELVKKIGLPRLLTELGSVCVDKKNGYELLLLNLADGRRRPYLKMQNPSVDEIHVEGVHPDVKTVDQALAWRNGMDQFTAPLVLT